jgi:hypothetical protein
VNGQLGAAKTASAALVLASVALVAAAGIGLLVLRDSVSRSDERAAASRANCQFENASRREANKQARAFIHHNTGTLRFFQRVYPLLRGQPQWRRAIRMVINVYLAVQTRYHTLPLIDCDRFVREGKLVPIRPEGGGAGGGGDDRGG